MNSDEFVYIKKLKKENKLKDSYLEDYYNRYLQLTVEIEGIKIIEPFLIKISLDKRSLSKINKLINVRWYFLHKEIKRVKQIRRWFPCRLTWQVFTTKKSLNRRIPP